MVAEGAAVDIEPERTSSEPHVSVRPVFQELANPEGGLGSTPPWVYRWFLLCQQTNGGVLCTRVPVS